MKYVAQAAETSDDMQEEEEVMAELCRRFDTSSIELKRVEKGEYMLKFNDPPMVIDTWRKLKRRRRPT